MLGEIQVANLSDEMFNDGLLFTELAKQTENDFEKWRYFRTSIMSFCSSAEAWVSKLIHLNLSKKNSLTEYEQGILDFLETPNKKMPKGFTSIKKRLYNFLPVSIDPEKSIGENNPKIERYIELSQMRNTIVHYSKKDFYNLYGIELECYALEAPAIIEEMFNEYRAIFPSILDAHWFRNRKSRVIE